MSHNPSVLFLFPWSKIFSFFIIYTFCLVKTAIQLSSQNWPIDSNDSLVKPGEIVAFVAEFEKPWNGRWPCADGRILVLFGRTAIGPLFVEYRCCKLCW